MSQESINRQLKEQHDRELKIAHDALRCTIFTEMHGDKWRIHGMGPKENEGRLQLITVVKEFDRMEQMLLALPQVVAEFYNVITPILPKANNICPTQPPQ
jgi:hypothetical protein